MSALARRYARAAVAAAADKGGMEAVAALASGLLAVRDAYRQSCELREALHNPSLRHERTAVLETVVQKLALSKPARRVLLLLAEKDRIDILEDVAAEAEAIADAQMGRLRARVTSAVPLTEAQISRLTRALEKRFGMPVAVQVAVEPAILGGLVCQVGDVTMDSSIRHQLEALRERLLA